MNQDAIDRETAEIARLEALSTDGMTRSEMAIHYTQIGDAYWRRRMAMRTPEEVAANVCAPGSNGLGWLYRYYNEDGTRKS